MYDSQGEEGLKNLAARGAQPQDPFGMFANLFGQQQQQQGDARGEDIRMDLRVTLEDLYIGRTFEVKVKNQILCPKCHGSGARSEDDVTQCTSCGGRGVKITMHSLGPGFMQASDVASHVVSVLVLGLVLVCLFCLLVLWCCCFVVLFVV